MYRQLSFSLRGYKRFNREVYPICIASHLFKDYSASESHGNVDGMWGINGAGNGVRTRDPQLGKLMLYQLSYSRSVFFW